jgi:hypothetical protein
MTKQSITSAGTCLNQVPAIFKLIKNYYRTTYGYVKWWYAVRDVVDFGGGSYDKFTDYLAKREVRNYVYDPYNRSKEHNDLVEKLLSAVPADVGICSNVLNVIREPAARHEALLKLRSMVKRDHYVFITVHEGDRSSRGRKTSRGWQANRPTKNYLREVRKVFSAAEIHGRLIVAVNESDVV